MCFSLQEIANGFEVKEQVLIITNYQVWKLSLAVVEYKCSLNIVQNTTMLDKREIANDLITLRDLIRWGTSQFNAAELNFAQGMPTAIDEAVYLCLSALHLPPDFSVEYFDCVLTVDERLHVLNLFQQRIV